MRVILIASLLLNGVAVFFLVRRINFQANLQTPDQRNAVYAHYKDDLFASIPQDTGKVILLGDSHVELSPFAEKFQNCLNRGIAGETAGHLLERLKPIFAGKPSAVLISIGENDLLQNQALPLAKLDSVLMFASTHCRLYVSSVMPVAGNYEGAAAVNQGVVKVNDYLYSLQAKYGFTLLRMDQSLSKDGYMNPAFTWDGLHLNPSGYARFEDSLTKYPDFILKNNSIATIPAKQPHTAIGQTSHRWYRF